MTMDQNELSHLKTWFSDYCASFSMPNQEDQRNLTLKQVHTGRVCENMLSIVRELGLSQRETFLAEVIALFHDVGRFPQYFEYKTFRDSTSVNHAARGIKVLLDNHVLKNIPRNEQKMITDAIAFHNVFTLPAGLDEVTARFSKLIRDADKLDIWRVFTEFYSLPAKDRWSAAGLGLPDSPGYSPGILDHFHRREMFLLSKLRNLNDFKLLQLIWVFDLSFKPSFRLLKERGYLDSIAAALPQTVEITRAVDVVREFVDENLADGTE